MQRLLWIMLISVLMAQAPALASPKFEAFIESLWPRVKAAGISRGSFQTGLCRHHGTRPAGP